MAFRLSMFCYTFFQIIKKYATLDVNQHYYLSKHCKVVGRMIGVAAKE